MKIGIIGNGSGAIYREAALAFQNPFYDTYIGNENTICSDLDTCDMFVVIGNYFRNYHADRAGPVKKYVADSGKPFIVVTGSLFNTKNPHKFIRLNVNGFCNNFACSIFSAASGLIVTCVFVLFISIICDLRCKIEST